MIFLHVDNISFWINANHLACFADALYFFLGLTEQMVRINTRSHVINTHSARTSGFISISLYVTEHQLSSQMFSTAARFVRAHLEFCITWDQTQWFLLFQRR